MSHVTLKKYGNGKDILVGFPGWNHPVEKEGKFLQLLTKKYTVYSVHLPGYVGNKDLNTFQDFTSIAYEIYEELKKIKGELVLIGFSMGCRLIMELEREHPNNWKKIFVGSPVYNYDIPIWAKLLLLNSVFINFLRKFHSFKLFVVNKALKTITQDKQAFFQGNNVTLTGSFDSLVGLLKSETNFKKYTNSALFIYGENDDYLKEAKKLSVKSLKVIDTVGHNCVRNNENKVINLIDAFIKV